MKALEVRLAGWYPFADQTVLVIDKTFDGATTEAVRSFQRFYGLAADGVAGPETFEVLDRLEDDDGSTLNFEWNEFKQNPNQSCSAEANAYAGTFQGGMAPAAVVKKNVRRLMWRLEAIRAKAGDNAIAINSGFRSVAYNDCIGGARASQHMYGTAADNRMADTENRFERDLARASQIHGIGCYSSLSHNHFDLRIDNRHLEGSRQWWWPEQDDYSRDLADDGSPCWGEPDDPDGPPGKNGRTSSSMTPLWPLLPTEHDLFMFEAAGEPDDLKGAD